ncbi:MAG: CPBP family intramembrane metalloprotease, partial [Candidatus Hydrogenedentes bacterium]|nr:CPBP family intramembrane metalloprotease [Candidatus Hydrogenedentota bacterium]
EPDDPEQALLQGRVDAVVTAAAGAAQLLADGRGFEVFIRFDATETHSREAAHRLTEGLRREAAVLQAERLQALGVAEEYINPLRVSRVDVAPPAKAAGTILGMVLPVLMVVMVGLGAFYPAIDLTAGEKERGTFETLLAAPVTTGEIVCGKYVTVCCLSLLTGLVNLGSIMLTIALQLSQLQGQVGQFELRFPPMTILLIAMTLVPLSLLVSAIMMSIAVCARSFREAQNFVAPFFLLMLFPAAYAGVPGASLTPITRLIPITNVALVFKDLMTGKTDADGLLEVLVITGLYALLALLLAAWLFRREEVVLSEERGIPLTWRRAEFAHRPAPTLGIALLAFVVSSLLVFYIGAYWQSRHLLSGLLVTQWGLILLPTLTLLWYLRVDLRQSLRLHRPSAAAAAATLLIATAWIPLAIQTTSWQNRILPMPESIKEGLGQVFLPDGGAGLCVLLFVVAISPAICEEVLFRGAVLSGLRGRVPAWAAWALAGLLFGMSHYSIHRAPVIILSGVMLAYVVWKSNSLYTGMAAHFMLNAFGVLAQLGRLPTPLRTFLEERHLDEQGLPLSVLLPAVAVFAAGIALMEFAARRALDSARLSR